MTTLKQEIKALKVGQEKIFKIDNESEYITIRKSKTKGLEIIVSYDEEDYEVPYDRILNNFKGFSLYDESQIDY
jgi:thermostable 8-oxoguanine DNA glycosylase